MTYYDAYNVLYDFQIWRRGNTDNYTYSPKELGEAIDVALTELSQLAIKEAKATTFEKYIAKAEKIVMARHKCNLATASFQFLDEINEEAMTLIRADEEEKGVKQCGEVVE